MTVYLQGPAYRGSFPVEELTKRIDFYKRMAKKKKVGQIYEPTISSLEHVANLLR